MADGSDAVVVRSLESISLKCPVTLTRIVQPCRTTRCKPHASCFCARAVAHLRVTDGSRACPICSARFADDELTIDARLAVFLAEHSAAERAAVRRMADGSFTYAAARVAKPKPAERPRTTLAAQPTAARQQPAAPRPPAPPQPALQPSSSSVAADEDEDARGAARPSAATVRLMVRFVPASADAARRPADDRGPVAPAAPSTAVAERSAAEIYTALTRGASTEARRQPESWRCAECDEWCVGERGAHERTIAHRFARSRAGGAALPAAAHVSLPLGNVGYRMLRGAGWEEGQGLGKANEGRLEPIATRLKRDRRGLRVMADARDSEEEAEEAQGARPTHPPLRVTHRSTEVMGPGCDVRAATKAERREQLRAKRAREAYLARCRELLATRSLRELDRPRSSG